MARTTEKVGRGPCPECGETITFRRSSGGKLTHACDFCDSSGYAEPSGIAYKKRIADMHAQTATPPPETTPTPAPKAEVTPTAKRVNSVFSLADL